MTIKEILAPIAQENEKQEQEGKADQEEYRILCDRKHVLEEKFKKRGPTLDEKLEGRLYDNFLDVLGGLESRDKAYKTYKAEVEKRKDLLDMEKQDKELIESYGKNPESVQQMLKGNYETAMKRDAERNNLRKGLESRLNVDVVVCPLSLVSKETSTDTFVVYLPIFRNEQNNELAENLAAHVASETIAVFGDANGNAYNTLKDSNGQNKESFIKLFIRDSTENQDKIKSYLKALRASAPADFEEANIQFNVEYIKKDDLIKKAPHSGWQAGKFYELPLSKAGKIRGYFGGKQDEKIMEIFKEGNVSLVYGKKTYGLRNASNVLRTGLDLMKKLKPGIVKIVSTETPGVYSIADNYPAPVSEQSANPEKGKPHASKTILDTFNDIPIRPGNISKGYLPAPCRRFWTNYASPGENLVIKFDKDYVVSIPRSGRLTSAGLISKLVENAPPGENVNIGIDYIGLQDYGEKGKMHTYQIRRQNGSKI